MVLAGKGRNRPRMVRESEGDVMRNDDPMYVRHLEQALEAAEKEIKGLEDELREKDRLLCEMQEQLAPPTFMGEPFIRNCSVSDNMQAEELRKAKVRGM